MSNFPYFIIEHIEEEFSKDFWCSIEYQNILRVVTPQRLIITNISPQHQANLPAAFRECAALTSKSLTEFLSDAAALTADNTGAVANAALQGLARALPAGGPTGESRICFLDEQGTGPLAPADLAQFAYIIVGGILGDHPPRDRGGHLRGLGFAVRHLGPRQMSTDTAVLACATVLRHATPIDALLYADDPEVYADEIDAVPRATATTATATAAAAAYATATADAGDADSVSGTGVEANASDLLAGTPLAVISAPVATVNAQATAIGSGSGGSGNPSSHEGYRESTTVRMRYLMHQQPALGAAVALDPALGLSEATGHWELSKPAEQRHLSTAPVNTPRITPGLLKHIFESADLEIDLADFELGAEDLEVGDGTAEDEQEMLRELFPGEEI